jgi:hypothetical protein
MDAFDSGEEVIVRVHGRWFSATIVQKLAFVASVLVKFDGWSSETTRAVKIDDVAKPGSKKACHLKPKRVWPADKPEQEVSDEDFRWHPDTMWQTIGSLNAVVTSDSPIWQNTVHTNLKKVVPYINETDGIYERCHSSPGHLRYMNRWLEAMKSHPGAFLTPIKLQQIRPQHNSPANRPSYPVNYSDDAMLSYADILFKKRIKSGSRSGLNAVNGADGEAESSSSSDSESENESDEDDDLPPVKRTAAEEAEGKPAAARTAFELFTTSEKQRNPNLKDGTLKSNWNKGMSYKTLHCE